MWTMRTHKQRSGYYRALVILPDLLTFDVYQAWHRDLNVWRRLHHENIIPLLGIAGVNSGHEQSLPLIICPWTETRNLNDYLQINANLKISDRYQMVSNDTKYHLEHTLFLKKQLHDIASGLAYSAFSVILLYTLWFYRVIQCIPWTSCTEIYPVWVLLSSIYSIPMNILVSNTGGRPIQDIYHWFWRLHYLGRHRWSTYVRPDRRHCPTSFLGRTWIGGHWSRNGPYCRSPQWHILIR